MSVLHAGAPAELWSSPARTKSRKDTEMEAAVLIGPQTAFKGSLKHKKLNQDGMISWESAEHVLESNNQTGDVVFAATDPDQCSIRVYLSDIAEVVSFGTGACRFDIVLKNDRTHSFLAPSPQFCQAWLENFKDYLPNVSIDNGSPAAACSPLRNFSLVDEANSVDLNGTWGDHSIVTARSALGSSVLPLDEGKRKSPSPRKARLVNEREEFATNGVRGETKLHEKQYGGKQFGGEYVQKFNVEDDEGIVDDDLDDESLHEEQFLDHGAMVKVSLDLPTAGFTSVKKKKKKKGSVIKSTKRRPESARGMSVTRSTASSLAKKRSSSLSSPSRRPALEDSKQGKAGGAKSFVGKQTQKSGRRTSPTRVGGSKLGARQGAVQPRRTQSISRSHLTKRSPRLSPRKPPLRSDLESICREQAAEISSLRRQIDTMRSRGENDQRPSSALSMESLLIQIVELKAELDAVRSQRDAMEGLFSKISEEHAKLKAQTRS